MRMNVHSHTSRYLLGRPSARSPVRRRSSNRASRPHPRRSRALFRALGLPSHHHAGRRRRGEDEPGQPLSLFPLEGRDRGRPRRARPRRGGGRLQRPCRHRGFHRKLRPTGAQAFRGEAAREGDPLPRDLGRGDPQSDLRGDDQRLRMRHSRTDGGTLPAGAGKGPRRSGRRYALARDRHLDARRRAFRAPRDPAELLARDRDRIRDGRHRGGLRRPHQPAEGRAGAPAERKI